MSSLNDLENWCDANDLAFIYPKLEELEFKNLDCLAMLDEDDTKELITELNLKFGKKANFLLAIEKLKRGTS